MKFVGVDLAWGSTARTGLCVAEAGRVLDSGLATTDEQILHWLRPHVTSDCLLAIDAPLVVRNQTGRRGCERLISRCFGKYHASAHSSNLGLPAFAKGVRGEVLASKLGVEIDPFFEPRRGILRAIEVYPHPALVALFGLPLTLKYKAKLGRTLDDRRGAFRDLLRHLESLAEGDPPLDVASSPRWRELLAGIAEADSGAEFDRFEDELDAYICVYVASYYWSHGVARCRVVGDLESGYIVTPVTAAQADCLDALIAISKGLLHPTMRV
jgi:predicted RNase H-like nuclease